MRKVDESSELLFTKWYLTVEPFGNGSYGYSFEVLCQWVVVMPANVKLTSLA